MKPAQDSGSRDDPSGVSKKEATNEACSLRRSP